MKKIRGLGTRERIRPPKRDGAPLMSHGSKTDDNAASEHNGVAPIRRIRGLGTRERIRPPKRDGTPIKKISGLGTRERIKPSRLDDNSTSERNGFAPIKRIYSLGTRKRKTPPKRFEGLRRPDKPRPDKKS